MYYNKGENGYGAGNGLDPYSVASLGYFTIMQYNPAYPISSTSLDSLILPATANGISYSLTTRQENGIGFVDVHRGFLGDANGDGIVDMADLAILANNWGQTGCDWSQGNFKGYGAVDMADLMFLASHWQTGIAGFANAAGSLNTDNMSWQAAMSSVVFGANAMFAPSASESVPEPASLALLTLGSLAMLRRRRK